MQTGQARAPEGRRLYAIGDTHGCLDLARDLFAQIEADMAAHDRDRDQCRIILLGDYCDRGPDTRGLVDFLIGKSKQHDMVFLLGNHDQRLMEFPVTAEQIGEAFLHYGGAETLASYGIEPAADPRSLGRAFARALPGSHRRFFEQAKLSHVEGDYFFAHAGVRPGKPLHCQAAGDLLWIRQEFLQHQGEFDKVVVHGHTPWDRVDIQPNRINIDTGAFKTGILSCVVLEGDTISILQTG